MRKLSSTGATLSAGSGQQKTVLNTQLDCLIKWLVTFLREVPDHCILIITVMVLIMEQFYHSMQDCIQKIQMKALISYRI